MSNIALVQRMVDRILIQDLESALDLIAEGVELMVLPDFGAARPEIRWGREAPRDYFGALGGIVTFWQVRLIPDGDQVLVWGKESYTTNGGIEAGSDFILGFQVRAGQIERILMVEDLAGAALPPTKLVRAHLSNRKPTGSDRPSLRSRETRKVEDRTTPVITATWEA